MLSRRVGAIARVVRRKRRRACVERRGGAIARDVCRRSGASPPPPKPDAGRARALSLSRFLRRCVHGCRVVSCPLWPRVSCQIEIKLERVVDLGPFKHKVD